MLQRALLRAATDKADGEHRRELHMLAAARRAESSAHDQLALREAAFWREVAANAGTPDRLLRAHDRMREAHRIHRGAEAGLRASGERCAHAQAVHDACQSLQRAAARREAALSESHAHESLSELWIAARVARRGQDELVAPAAERAGAPPGCFAPPVEARLGSSGAPASLTEPSALHPEGGGCVVDSAQLHTSPSEARLECECVVGVAQRPVGISVVATLGRGMQVLVRVPDSLPASQLNRERSNIAERLAALGLEVAKVSVERRVGQPLGLLAWHAGRRRQRGMEEDEERIA